MSSPAAQRFTPEEYLALERESETKHEFYDGQIFAMAGVSYAHVKICANLIAALIVRFRGSSCTAGASDLRVKVAKSGLFTYPDVFVVCGKPELEHIELDVLLNPRAIFEVLSPSTERYDRGRKFALYQGLESLSDYVLVAQDMARVEHYEREDAGHWRLSVYDSLTQDVAFAFLGGALPMSAIYDGVELGPNPPLREDIPSTQLPG